MMTASIFSFALAAGYTLFMFLIRCDASKIADIDLSIFGDASMKATKHQKGVLAGMLLFIIGATIISFGSLIDSPITNFFAKIGVYGWLFAILAIMMIAFSLIGSLSAGGIEMNSVMMIIGAMIFSQIVF